MVASAAAGATYGLAKTASIVSVRWGPCDWNWARQSDYVAALRWVIEDHRQQVAAGHASDAVVIADNQIAPNQGAGQEALNVVTNGMTFVCSAGSDRNLPSQGIAPCDWEPQRLGGTTQGLLTVGATGSTDAVAAFSNQGACVDMFAPGANVTVMQPGGAAGVVSGTSISAPYAGGVAALYLDVHQAIRRARSRA